MMPLAARFLILVLSVVSLAFSCRAESPGALDRADWIPTFRQDDGHRIMTNDSMLHILHRRIPSFVDPTGQTLDTTPGLVVGIVTDSGREVVGFGTKRIGQNSPPDGDTCFGIASLTKIFTGFVLAKAVCEGTVRLDDSANRYLKNDIKLKDNSITLRQLVTHTSGLPDMPTNIRASRDLDKDGKSDFEDLNPARHYTREMLADFLRTEAETEIKPGSRFQYSNLGIYNAWCDRVPVIVVGGNDLDAAHRPPGVPTFHSAQDINAIVRDFTKWDDTPVGLQHYAQSFVRAYKIAMTPPYGPVAISLDAGSSRSRSRITARSSIFRATWRARRPRAIPAQ